MRNYRGFVLDQFDYFGDIENLIYHTDLDNIHKLF